MRLRALRLELDSTHRPDILINIFLPMQRDLSRTMDRRNNDVVFAKLENLSGNGDLVLYTDDLASVVKPCTTSYHFSSPLS